jgi:hypothetical protein
MSGTQTSDMQGLQDSLQHPCIWVTKLLRRIRRMANEEISLPTRSSWHLMVGCAKYWFW